MADGGAICSPCVAPCASFESRTRMGRAATWNAAGCGSGLSVSDMELVRCKSRPCGPKRKVAVPRPRQCGRKRKVAVPADGGGKLIGSHEHMN